MTAPLLGSFAYLFTWMEARRLAKGWSYEPPTFYELNERAKTLSVKVFEEKRGFVPQAACL